MRYVAAYLLAVLGGNDKPTDAEIKKILSSVGIDADSGLVKTVVGELSGKNVEELIEIGRKKLASMPSAGPAVASTVNTGEIASRAEPAKVESKKELPKEEEDDEDADMGFGLFD